MKRRLHMNRQLINFKRRILITGANHFIGISNKAPLGSGAFFWLVNVQWRQVLPPWETGSLTGTLSP